MGAAGLRHPFGIIIGLSGRSRSSGRGGSNTRFGLWVHAPPTEPLEKTCNVPDRSDADQQEAPSMSNFCGRADIKIRERHFRELAREYDPPAHAHVVVEIHDVPVVHANAAPRDKIPDGPWAVCPMYCQLIIIEDKRGGSHWITRRIGGNDHVGLPRLISAGGDQAGRRCLLAILVHANHCLSTRPTPTGYRMARLFATTR